MQLYALGKSAFQNSFRGKITAICSMGIVLYVNSTVIVLADIAPDPTSGGKNLSRQGKEKTNVAMIDEVVQLKLTKDQINVNVDFIMKNTGKVLEAMQIGFPLDFPEELKDFRATVNEKEATVQDTTKKYLIERPSGRPSRVRYEYWKTWEAKFHPQQPVKILVNYSAKNFEVGTFLFEGLVLDHSFLVNKFSVAERPDIIKLLETRVARYVLVTGSHWSGPIGRCRVELTFDGLTSDNLCLEMPYCEHEPNQRNRDRIIWDIKNYEPKGDIVIGYTPNATRQQYCELLEKVYKIQPEDRYVVQLLAGYRAALGNHIEASQLWLDHLKPWQEKIAIWGPGSDVELTRQQSEEVLRLIRKLTIMPPSKGSTFPKLQKPEKISPVIEKIALKLKDQCKLAPVKQKDYATTVEKDLDQILAWCAKLNAPLK